MPGVISFAGGLPNRDLFPVKEIQAATDTAFARYGSDLLQYSASEGFGPLREWISRRYKERGLDIPATRILITGGSQQGLDLLGKILLNNGDPLIIEEPGYLGAIQAFALYRAKFLPVPVSGQGMDTDRLDTVLRREHPKLMYAVPNFQNPSGITYPERNRRDVARLIEKTGTILIEDDPYGELSFTKKRNTSFQSFLPNRTVLLGSFSKTVAPGLRIGWIAAPEAMIRPLVIAKQAADLQTNPFAQCILYQYLSGNNPDAHIARIAEAYGAQKEIMRKAMLRYFPPGVSSTNPEGGMFLWVTLPQKIAALDLFEHALKDKVVFVPGDPFYIPQSRVSTLRLNYSCVDAVTIETGIKRLGRAMGILLGDR